MWVSGLGSEALSDQTEVSQCLFFIGSLYTQPDGRAENHHTANQSQRTGSKLSRPDPNKSGWLVRWLVDVVILTT